MRKLFGNVVFILIVASTSFVSLHYFNADQSNNEFTVPILSGTAMTGEIDSNVNANHSVKNNAKKRHTKGMENSVNPLLNHIVNQACYPNGADYANKGESASLIYKRESMKSCTSGTGNILYARCYTSEWRDKALFYKPIRDVRLANGTHSCIRDSEVNIPYYDERLAKSELGVEYLVVNHESK